MQIPAEYPIFKLDLDDKGYLHIRSLPGGGGDSEKACEPAIFECRAVYFRIVHGKAFLLESKFNLPPRSEEWLEHAEKARRGEEFTSCIHGSIVRMSYGNKRFILNIGWGKFYLGDSLAQREEVAKFLEKVHDLKHAYPRYIPVPRKYRENLSDDEFDPYSPTERED
jgi:hypothetical protein